MTIYENYCHLRDEKNVRDSDVSRETGIGKSTFSDWKSGRSIPKQEKLQKIADYFGVSLDYLSGNAEEKIPFPVDEYVYGFLKETAKQEGKNGSCTTPQSGLSKRTLNIIALLNNLSEDGLTEVENFVEFQLNKNQNNPSDNQKDSHKTEQPGIYVRKKI